MNTQVDAVAPCLDRTMRMSEPEVAAEYWHPNVLLLVEGVISISLQLLVIRQLVPFVGSSINVTSIVITVFLAALAIGYWAGGRSAQPSQHINRNLIGLCLSLPVFFSYPFVEGFFNIGYAIDLTPLVVATLYCLLCLSPVVYLLGQFVVLLVHFKAGEGAAAKAGDTFYVSTIGNVVGGLLTTLVIMYYFGMAVALAFMSGLVCVCVGMSSLRRAQKGSVIGLALGLSIVGVVYEHQSFLRTTAYANYYVVSAEESRFLVVNGQNASRSDVAGQGHGYIEWMEDRLETLSTSAAPLQVLVLGAGGFTLGQGRDLNVTWQFVDVDAHLPKMAEAFLQRTLDTERFSASDARAWLAQTSVRFDVVVVDVFSHRTSVPDHLLTYQFFELIRSRLKPDGRVLMNVIVRDDPSRFARGFENTLRHVFADCESTRLVSPTPFHNRLFDCGRSPWDGYRQVYSDHNTRGLVDGSER